MSSQWIDSGGWTSAEPPPAARGAPRERTVTPPRLFAERADTIVFSALIAGLAWAPLWFGSARYLAWGVNAVFFGVLALLYEIMILMTGRRHPVSLRMIWFPALTFVALCAFVIVQIAPGLPETFHHPIWKMASDLLKRDIPGVMSINRDEPAIALLRFVTCGLVFWIALQLCRSSARAKHLVTAVAVIGLAYAVYGVLGYFVFPDQMLWFEKEVRMEGLTSTFVNRNSYATYGGLGLISALCMLARRSFEYNHAAGESIGRRVAALAAAMVGGLGLWIVCSFVIGLSVVLSGSRGGVSATVAGMLVIGLIVGVRGRKKPVAAGSALALGGLTIGAAFFIYGDFLADRLVASGFASDPRGKIYSLTWRSIMDAPFVGFGDGTFSRVITMYRDMDLGPLGKWDMAHNSYLELFQGVGLPMGALFLSGVAWLAARVFVASLTRRRSIVAPMAAIAATTLVALHALADFSLQIQAVALTWAALFGAGVAQSWSSRVEADR